MKLPLAWLRDYVKCDLDAASVATRFASLGFPVEAVEQRPLLSGIVVGRLTDVSKHAAADRLQVCAVDVGTERALTIVTAAANVQAGDVVPVATIGAQLVGLRIAPRTMRGIASQGMLVSAGEIGLEPTWFEDGILQLERDLLVGTDFVAAFGLGEAVLDVEVTANRVDAMSVLGLARELAAALGTAVHEPSLAIERSVPPPTSPDCVRLESPDCKRFVAQRIDDVHVGTAPFWMRLRLALAGQRPIDSVVDVSNFVMLEGAQPLHFYDADRIAGGTLVVRDARAGERLRTIDGEERALDERFLVIADSREPQCIAGLRGAAASEVSTRTRALLIEAATFAGPRVRRMSVALGVRTEASSRHEKGLPLALSTWGAARAAHLLERGGASVHAPVAFGAETQPAEAIAFPAVRVPALLGREVSRAEAAHALQALGFGVVTVDDRIEATPPPWRGDVRIAEDVVEEIARIIGYDRIPPVLPPLFPAQVSSDAYRRERRVAHALAALGYVEAVTFALQSGAVAEGYRRTGIALPNEIVEIRNPLSDEQRYLRFSLVPGLLAHAAAYAGDDPLRTFELGHVFAGPEPAETVVVTWLAALPHSVEPAWRDDGFLMFKGESCALLRTLTGRDPEAVAGALPEGHPGKTAALLIDGTAVATVGAVDPRLLGAYEIDRRVYVGALNLADLPAYHLARYIAPSKYPAVERDLALVVAPDVSAADIEQAVRLGADGAISGVRVFDEYRGPQVAEGKKSLAVRVVLQRFDGTLTDAEADAYVGAILASLHERCGAILRE
ncbi:MAG: phenylalanine--tRNA ligase subunit beta [Candidatus Eremiobacteraeota bacterium]|nr:phenylalanine--tRNA ligase subunit beta [Candidatus Eremiobacteraeota bacterium]MBC5801823.1 phenylalanine--tRNA ligase subunit beta [Candidatus Eremiobacteraeota bacterium]MBC5820489.1 phenylalanine--tRNA ligase subunit beta [Candidatus Eremiobacteraeota bacterium]